MAMTQCRHFSGYKPCARSSRCDESCRSYDVAAVSLLIVHLGALGAVVRSTSLLKAMKRKFPSSQITWVTDAPAHRLLQGHPAIDRVLTTSDADLLQLSALEFDIGFVIDKSLKASGVLRRTVVEQVYGFVADPRSGAILPATAAAEELWSLGLDNHLKFHVNKKPETQLMMEALELGPFQRDEYWLPLTESEQQQTHERRQIWLGDKQAILGINTGCSAVIQAKRFTVEFQRRMIQTLAAKFPQLQMVLLGGPEDSLRNQQIAADLPVISSATEAGLRDGLVSVAACDLVITGDSLGLHMAISQQKTSIAWFGPTCAHEIDLYGRGVALLASSACSPCWKRSCEKTQMCYDQVSLEEIVHAVESCGADCLSRGSPPLDTTA